MDDQKRPSDALTRRTLRLRAIGIGAAVALTVGGLGAGTYAIAQTGQGSPAEEVGPTHTPDVTPEPTETTTPTPTVEPVDPAPAPPPTPEPQPDPEPEPYVPVPADPNDPNSPPMPPGGQEPTGPQPEPPPAEPRPED